MINIDLHKPKLLTRESLVAVVFAAAGIYWFTCGNWLLGLFGLLLALSAGFLYKGLGFDLDARCYRVYTGLFKWKFGAWEHLPTICGVTIKYFSVLSTSGRQGRMRTDKIGEYILILSVSGSIQGIVLQRFSLNQKEYALALGNQIAQFMQVPLATFF